MKYFEKIADGVMVAGLALDLFRQPDLWDRDRDRTEHGEVFRGTSDIWARFRARAELTTPEAWVEPHVPVFWPAWYRLPHLRPLVFGLMARVEAVQLGGVLITRVPSGGRVAAHDDRGRWHSEWFNAKAYLPIETNPDCYNTCGDEIVTMGRGEAWLFDNLQTHSTVNSGETDRVTLIVSMRVE